MSHSQKPVVYPQEMAEVARSIRLFLDEQWARYLRLYYQDPDALTPQLDGLVKFTPEHKRAELRAQMDQIHAHIAASYRQLYSLADQLDGGQQRQGHTDQRSARGVHLE